MKKKKKKKMSKKDTQKLAMSILHMQCIVVPRSIDRSTLVTATIAQGADKKVAKQVVRQMIDKGLIASREILSLVPEKKKKSKSSSTKSK